jgi:hypothetical protein
MACLCENEVGERRLLGTYLVADVCCAGDGYVVNITMCSDRDC